MRIPNYYSGIILFMFVVADSACSHKHIQTDSSSMSTMVTVFKGARIIDGSGNSALENANLVIEGDHILAIQASTVPIPDDAQILDMRGKTIMPTLIDAHSHLLQTEHEVSLQLQKFTQYGVGAVASHDSDLDFIYALRKRRLLHELQVPLMLTAGHGLKLPGLKNLKEVKKVLREIIELKPDFVEIDLRDPEHSPSTHPDPNLAQEIVKEAHAANLKVAASIFYLEDAKQLASAQVDFFVHSIRDQKVDQELIKLMKKNHVAYIPTLSLEERQPSNPAAQKQLKLAKENVRRLFQAGIAIGLGTSSDRDQATVDGFAEHREIELLVSTGMAPLQAIKSATLISANILGINGDYGMLQAGRKASLIVLNNNPLEDITNTLSIQSVWIDGVQKFVASP